MRGMESFQLDTPTLVIALMVVYAGSFIFSLALYLAKRSFPGASQWITGQALLLFGALGAGGEVFGLPYWVLGLANTAMIASMVLMNQAVYEFRGKRNFPRGLFVLIPISLVLWFFPLGEDLRFRVLWFSGMLGVLASWTVSMLVRAPEAAYRIPYRSAAVFFLLIAIAGLSRMVGVIIGYIPLSLAVQGRMNTSMYALAILAAFFQMFGYFFLISLRTEQTLRDNELAIQRRNDSLNHLVAMKDALITVVGHDLRAPIASAARYTRNHLLDYPGNLEDKRESVAILAEGLDRADALLANLVDWARSASGRMEFRLEPSDLAAIAREEAKVLATSAERKNMRIVVAEGAWLALADARAASTVIRNLISNAIKYSQPDTDVSVYFHTDEPDHVTASVADKGVGMSEQQLASLFEPGKTIQTLGTDGEQGTGLGLALCKSFMEAQSGELHVSSQTGVGTRIDAVFLQPSHATEQPAEALEN